jgi:hypothetical protein
MPKKMRPCYQSYRECFEALGLKPLSYRQWWRAVRHAR